MRKHTFKKFIFVIFLFTQFSNLLYADSDISFNNEFGRRAVYEDYENVDIDDNYRFSNTSLKFKQDISSLTKYYVQLDKYTRNYENIDSLDNTSKIIKTRLFNKIKIDKGKTLSFSGAVKYREKRYVNTPLNEYDQVKVDAKINKSVKDKYGYAFSAGVNDFLYAKAEHKDVFNIFAKVEYLNHLTKELKAKTDYKIESSNKKISGRKKNKEHISLTLDYKLKKKLIDKITMSSAYGQTDTREEEDNDYDTDYTYNKFRVKTYHVVAKRIKTNLEYHEYKKDYEAILNDYKSIGLQNKWDIEILDVSDNRSWIDIQGKYDKIDYYDPLDDDYNKKCLGATFNYKAKDIYKTFFTVSDDVYKYSLKLRDRNIYRFKTGLEYYFLNNDLTLSFKYGYYFVDYTSKNNTIQRLIKLGANYKF